MIHVRRSVNTA